jgi:diketogulonate reductase-like aldo/keto reductase
MYCPSAKLQLYRERCLTCSNQCSTLLFVRLFVRSSVRSGGLLLQAQLALAWCLKNKHVSTVILGASKVEQLKENIGALHVAAHLTPSVMAGEPLKQPNRPSLSFLF